MRRNLCRVGLGVFVVLLLLAGHAFAQNLDIYAYAYNVPFAFRVGTVNLPAGEYAVRIASATNGIISIEGLNGGARAMFLTYPYDKNGQTRRPITARLVFNQYGNAYFLSKIWSGSSSLGLQLPQSSAEREFISQAGIPKTIEIALSRR